MYRRAGRGRMLLFAFLALSIVVITLDFRQSPDGPLERAKDLSNAIVAPLQRGFTAVTRPVGNFFSSVGELGQLQTENSRLNAELEVAETELTEALSLAEENESLRELLYLNESWATMEREAASVIGFAPANYKWAIFIDKGRADGIRADMSVVNTDGLVGKVIRTRSSTATVLLLIDPQASARARVEGAEGRGVISGNGGDETLSLGYVDTDAEVSVGDDVLTAGYDRGIFPPSIPIGEVTSVTTGGGATEQEIAVRPWVDFSSLDFVMVLLESGARLQAEED